MNFSTAANQQCEPHSTIRLNHFLSHQDKNQVSGTSLNSTPDNRLLLIFSLCEAEFICPQTTQQPRPAGHKQTRQRTPELALHHITTDMNIPARQERKNSLSGGPKPDRTTTPSRRETSGKGTRSGIFRQVRSIARISPVANAAGNLPLSAVRTIAAIVGTPLQIEVALLPEAGEIIASPALTCRHLSSHPS